MKKLFPILVLSFLLFQCPLQASLIVTSPGTENIYPCNAGISHPAGSQAKGTDYLSVDFFDTSGNQTNPPIQSRILAVNP
jgi:hypothetical protein